MTKNHVFRSVLLAAGALALAACASQPAPKGSLAEKQFQRAAKQYQVFERDGQKVYCKMANTKIVPHTCLSESELRLVVERSQRERNPVVYVRSPPGVG
jgi:PBP1b-binding outer membrane lipoprotein LpoB